MDLNDNNYIEWGHIILYYDNYKMYPSEQKQKQIHYKKTMSKMYLGLVM